MAIPRARFTCVGEGGEAGMSENKYSESASPNFSKHHARRAMHGMEHNKQNACEAGVLIVFSHARRAHTRSEGWGQRAV